ncbi:MAG TPA: anaerobic sulfatase maturase [Longimicrobiales bacterium]|nr:anaerobic sulfatase maturase [Longimicrobiales bacterium]
MSPAPFHVMAKPTGALCNLACRYCYYLEKERLYPAGETFRMPGAVLEAFVRQHLAAQPGPEVDFTWQGGEPTLLGLDFFREVVRIQREHAGGRKVSNALQTNGTLLDDAWCAFLAEEGFLVGLSLDGPERLHDAVRPDKGAHATFTKVMRTLDLLRRHGTEFNTLTVVSSVNAGRPLDVYRFLKEAGSTHLQFIPLVERRPDAAARALGLDLALPPALPGGATAPSPAGESAAVTPETVSGAAYGAFLLSVFDEWVRNDVGRVFVQLFDVTLAGWTGMEPPLCVFRETCGDALVLEHDGSLFSCDHYVYPAYRLGSILETPLAELAGGPAQAAFGRAKLDALPRYCRECEVRFLCNGECPKHRFIAAPDGEPGLNWLCEGYKAFFTRTAPWFQAMAQLLERGRPPAEVMRMVAERDRAEALARAGRNDPCPCGSGRKFKSCCGGKGRADA